MYTDEQLEGMVFRNQEGRGDYYVVSNVREKLVTLKNDPVKSPNCGFDSNTYEKSALIDLLKNGTYVAEKVLSTEPVINNNFQIY